MSDDVTNNPLITLREDIEAHWREFRPQMVAELEATERLSQATLLAATRTEEAVLNAVAAGMNFWQAWVLYREEWAFLPVEGEEGPEWYGPDDEAWWKEIE